MACGSTTKPMDRAIRARKSLLSSRQPLKRYSAYERPKANPASKKSVRSLLDLLHLPGIEVRSDPEQKSRCISGHYVEQGEIVDVTAIINRRESDNPYRVEQMRVRQGLRDFIREPHSRRRRKSAVPWPNSPPNFPNAQPFAMRTLGTCSRNIEPIAKPVTTFAGHLNVRPGIGAIAPARL
jgi:hypothetical protein